MDKIIQYIKSIFQKRSKFILGALPSVPDSRNVRLSAIQSPVLLPDTLNASPSPVQDQGQKPQCTCYATVEQMAASSADHADLDPNWLYQRCKQVDGIPEADGTYPEIPLKIAHSEGVPTKQAVASNDAAKIALSASQHKITYAQADNDYDSICQAVMQNGGIVASFDVDGNFMRGVMAAVLKSLGRHECRIFDFVRSRNTLIVQNSWGSSWIGYVSGIFDPKIRDGCFEVRYNDIKATIGDLYVITDVPQELLDAAKAQHYKFQQDMKIGSKGYDVMQLQKRLIAEGCMIGAADGSFGKITASAVAMYQGIHGLPVTGNALKLARTELNRQ